MSRGARTAGEQWAREELDRLRTARFRPGAVAAFLGASHRRSRQIRRDRPDLARRANRWEATGMVATLAAVHGRRHADPATLAASAAWWAAVTLMLEWHLGMVETQDGQPRNLGPADALTLSRAWLVPLIAIDARAQDIVLAAATDVLDGPLARATAPTRAGRDLEGLADAVVAVAALHRLGRDGRTPKAVGTVELTRLAIGTAYGFATYLGRAAPPSSSLLRAGRTTTPVRFAGTVLAARGHRTAGGALLLAGSAAGIAAIALELRTGRPATSTVPTQTCPFHPPGGSDEPAR